MKENKEEQKITFQEKHREYWEELEKQKPKKCTASTTSKEWLATRKGSI